MRAPNLTEHAPVAVAVRAMFVVVALLLWPAAAGAQAGAADLSVSRLDGLTYQPTPATIRFIVQVRNQGPEPAAAVELLVALPDGVEAVSGSWWRAAGGGDVATGGCAVTPPPAAALTCSMGTVFAGDAATVEAIVVNRGVPAGSTVEAAVAVSAATPDPGSGDDATAVPLTFSGGPLVDGPADLQLSASPLDPWSPSVVATTVQVANSTPVPAADVKMVATVSPGAGLVSRGGVAGTGVLAGGGGVLPPCDRSDDARTLSCVLPGPLGFNGQLWWSMLVVNTGLPAGSTAELRIELSWAGSDATPGDLMVLPVPFTGASVALAGTDVRVDASPVDGSRPMVPGTAIADVVVNSSGPADAVAVEVTFEAPAGVQLASALVGPSVMTGATCSSPQPAELRCTLDRPPSHGAPAHLSVVAVNVGLPDDASAELRATVRHAGVELDPSNDTALLSVTLPGAAVPVDPEHPTAELQVRTDEARLVAWDGPAVVFTWTITSRGPAPATGFRAVVQLGPGLTVRHVFAPGMGVQCTVDTEAAQVRCGGGFQPLPPGLPVQLTVVAHHGAVPGAVLEAEAFVSSDLADLLPVDNRAAARATVPGGVAGGATTPIAPVVTGAPVGGATTVTTRTPALPATGASPWPAAPAVGGALVASGLALIGMAGAHRRARSRCGGSSRPTRGG